MNMKQKLILVALCLCLVGCCGEIYYEHCPDVLSFNTRYMALRNDLTIQTYYCGSDDRWHYFAIKRHIVVFDDIVGITLPQNVGIPFAIRKYSNNRDQWQTIDYYDDWINNSNFNAEQQ